jgi:hypothetical protein
MKMLPVNLVALALLIHGSAPLAEEGDWRISTDLQGIYGPYSGSALRDSLASAGLFLHADYLEAGGITVGYNRTAVGFVDTDFDIDQDQVFASAFLSAAPDWAAGSIGIRLDGHWIDNNDNANGTGELSIFAPLLSYMNFQKTLYFDIGYARSSYGDATDFSGKLTVDQLTPTIGFGFGEGRDWLQARGYLIDPSNPSRAQGKSDTSAVELKWMHWFSGPGPLGINKITLTGLVGERVYAVDPDSAVVYNIADVQKGGVAAASTWRINDRNEILVQLGYEQYTNELIADDYSYPYLYVDFTHNWN